MECSMARDNAFADPGQQDLRGVELPGRLLDHVRRDILSCRNMIAIENPCGAQHALGASSLTSFSVVPVSLRSS